MARRLRLCAAALVALVSAVVLVDGAGKRTTLAVRVKP